MIHLRKFNEEMENMKHIRNFKLFEAILPDSHDKREELIGNMKVGEWGYTVSWALKVDMDGECYIRTDYTIDKQKGGTVNLKVKRVEDGFIAYIYELKDTKFRREVIEVDVLPIVSFDDKYIPVKDSLEDLKKQLSQALENEDYKKAAMLKNKISNFKK